MGYIYKGGIRVHMESLQFRSHFQSQLGVQVTERFVHKEDLRAWSKCPGNSHPLLLTAAELRGITGSKLLDLKHGQHFSHPFLDSCLVPL